MYKDVHFSAATDAIATKYTSMYISEPPRMAVIPRSSDVSALSETRVQKLTRMSIQKQHGCCWFQTETSFLFRKKLVSQKCTWMYTFDEGVAQ